MRKSFFFLCFICLIVIACSSDNANNVGIVHHSNQDYVFVDRDRMIRTNQELNELDCLRIIAYIKRHQLEMKQDKSGIWLQKFGKSNTSFPITKGANAVSYDYEISLLDGTLCYTSAISGPKTIKPGKGGIESGLEIGLEQLRQGDSAAIIIPPYLAHGMLGDDNKIPTRAILIAKVRIISVE